MLTLKTAPASLASALLETVCDHLRHASHYALPDIDHIEALTEAAVTALDGPGGKLRRALMTQTWTATFDAFAPELHLQLPPVQCVTSVKYRDPAGYLQTLGASNYRLVGGSTWDPFVAPAYGVTWPATREEAEAVKVEFVTGYGNADALPAPLRQAILMTVAHWYQNREATITGTIVATLPIGVAELIQPYRVYR